MSSCRKNQEDYEKYKEIIKNVKRTVMEWMEDVEEARYFVEGAMKIDIDVNKTGENLDPEKHKDGMECYMEGKKKMSITDILIPKG